MKLPSLKDIEEANEIVYQSMQASPQLSWPILNEKPGYEIWVKNENHNPTSAFKIRGGIIYAGRLKARHPDCFGDCCATRGNHDQSVAFAAAKHGRVQLPLRHLEIKATQASGSVLCLLVEILTARFCDLHWREMIFHPADDPRPRLSHPCIGISVIFKAG